MFHCHVSFRGCKTWGLVCTDSLHFLLRWFFVRILDPVGWKSPCKTHHVREMIFGVTSYPSIKAKQIQVIKSKNLGGGFKYVYISSTWQWKFTIFDWRYIDSNGWCFQRFVMFTLNLGEMIQFDDHILLRWVVCLNHHLVGWKEDSVAIRAAHEQWKKGPWLFRVFGVD